MKTIEFDKVVAGYTPSLTILNETTLDARKGEITLLIGPNERDFVSQGVETRVRWNVATGPVSHRVEYGLRLHHDRVERRHSENGFLVHRPTGVFCYGFYRHEGRPSGEGTRYRATVIGPGVTPDVTWEGRPLRPYSRTRDLQLHAEQRELYRGDEVCSPV